jgi:hypothetical protein
MKVKIFHQILVLTFILMLIVTGLLLFQENRKNNTLSSEIGQFNFESQQSTNSSNPDLLSLNITEQTT